MASRGGPGKRPREPSTPNSRRRSKRYYGRDSLEASSERPRTPPGLESTVKVDELTASVRSLGLVDTPKSSRNRTRGVRGQLEGKVLFEEQPRQSRALSLPPRFMSLNIPMPINTYVDD